MSQAGESPAPDPAGSTMRRDVLSAYAASGAKVLSWVIVSAIVFRAGSFHFAVLALVRGTLGLLTYSSIGLAPALVRRFAEATDNQSPRPRFDQGHVVPLAYARPIGAETSSRDPARSIYSTGLFVALLTGCVGFLLVYLYSKNIDRLHYIPAQVLTAGGLAFFMGIGFVLRLISEASAAVIQTSGAIHRDNSFLVLAETAWVAFTLIGLTPMARGLYGADAVLFASGISYAFSGLILCFARGQEAARVVPIYFPDMRLVNRDTVKSLLGLGSLISIAQLADFLYAPTDYILINRLISPGTVAYYAPAVQINAGLLLLVGGLAAVLLPKAATAHAAGDAGKLRRYYVRGTLASAGVLLVASVAVYFLSPTIFRLWLGDPLPQTQAILPLVLLHTVLGGSGGVGRSILLGMGKAKPFAIGVLAAGATNVVISYCCVKYFGMGLPGIVWGTIAAAFGLHVMWQPWYVLRTLRREAAKPLDTALAVAATHETPL